MDGSFLYPKKLTPPSLRAIATRVSLVAVKVSEKAKREKAKANSPSPKETLTVVILLAKEKVTKVKVMQPRHQLTLMVPQIILKAQTMTRHGIGMIPGSHGSTLEKNKTRHGMVRVGTVITGGQVINHNIILSRLKSYHTTSPMPRL